MQKYNKKKEKIKKKKKICARIKPAHKCLCSFIRNYQDLKTMKIFFTEQINIPTKNRILFSIKKINDQTMKRHGGIFTYTTKRKMPT